MKEIKKKMGREAPTKKPSAAMLMQGKKSVRDRLRRFIYPLNCLVCGARIGSEENALCTRCYALFLEECGMTCTHCGEMHIRCRCPLDGLPQMHLAPYHSQVAQRLVLLGKEHVYSDLLEFWGKLLQARILAQTPRQENAVICYVPRAPESVRQKGCDQAKLLASSLSEKIGYPLVRAISRKKAQGSFFFRRPIEQKLLTPRERRDAASKSYALTEDAPSLVKGKTIYLVDDVITTGATVGAVADLLRAAGAARIFAVSVAKS